ncbi:acetyl-coenzyme A transporter 1-domain-containing protein [Entophlyctis helioformis]|nr:acetyl-coenzyme A transporter 1-domain-containing protein [Entophlyctis helioformis]
MTSKAAKRSSKQVVHVEDESEPLVPSVPSSTSGDGKAHMTSRGIKEEKQHLLNEASKQGAAVPKTNRLPPPAKHSEPDQFRKDLPNIALLVFLYLLQGVPLGLCMGSVPFLLKSKLGYSDLALFSLSSYPYSLKLLWSPIVDTLYFKSIGRRKSWIVPIQAIMGLSLIMLGRSIDAMLEQDKLPVGFLAGVFTTIVFLCATQDIAVDGLCCASRWDGWSISTLTRVIVTGWALTLLHDDNKTYASTAQTIGLNTGYFLSFTVFLALNSPEVCNAYLRSTPLDVGILQLGPYLQFWGVMFLICNAWLIFFKVETPDLEEVDSIASVYKTMANICMMPHMTRFIGVLLLAKIGFIANEAVTGLKLLELGLSKEDLALAVLLDFPLEIIFGYYAAKWSSGSRPLRPWLYAFYGRLAAAAFGMFVVYSFPSGGVTTSYFAIVMVATVFSSFMGTLQFVGLGSYFTKISDPSIGKSGACSLKCCATDTASTGGTYMTLLNTLSNLGGTWPRYFVLLAVDWLQTRRSPIKCSEKLNRDKCAALGGTCEFRSDGYYTVNTACIVIGLVSLILFIRPNIHYFESLRDHAWRLRTKEK